MRDGYSTSKSLGMGLPGAKRLMDEFEIIIGHRRRHDHHDEEVDRVSRAHLTWGVAEAPMLAGTESGDSHVREAVAEGVLAAVIDGIGHGDEAADAARIAGHALTSSPARRHGVAGLAMP